MYKIKNQNFLSSEEIKIVQELSLRTEKYGINNYFNEIFLCEREVMNIRQRLKEIRMACTEEQLYIVDLIEYYLADEELNRSKEITEFNEGRRDS